MKKYVLFSPVGSTDPIRNDYDGPMLHIARYYKPQKVYLFLTAEMSERDRKNDIYAWSLQQLDSDIEVIKLYHDDIDKPQVMDKFDEYYPQDLQKIYEENPGCTILANVTSGTAQMMTSLRLFAARAPFPLELIAVDTPARKSNDSTVVKDAYDKQTAWQNNLDNDISPEIECRCHAIHHDNIKKTLVKSIIDEYLKSYDYKGAITVLGEAQGFFSPELPIILQAADYRIHLEHNKAQKDFDKTALSYKMVYTVQSTDSRDIYEYILHLQRLGTKAHLLEFAQGFSPILYRLSYIFLKKILKIKIDDFVYTDNKGVKRYDERKMPDKYKQAIKNEFGRVNYTTPLNTANLLPLIACEAVRQNKTNAYEIINKLRDFEKDVRNIAAHEISAVSEETFKNNAQTNCSKILKDLKSLYQGVFSQAANWNSYDEMNNKIKQYL